MPKPWGMGRLLQTLTDRVPSSSLPSDPLQPHPPCCPQQEEKHSPDVPRFYSAALGVLLGSQHSPPPPSRALEAEAQGLRQCPHSSISSCFLLPLFCLTTFIFKLRLFMKTLPKESPSRTPPCLLLEFRLALHPPFLPLNVCIMNTDWRPVCSLGQVT